MNKLHIGIDPGVITGLAVWCSSQKEFRTITQCNIWQAIHEVWQLHEEHSIFVYVEDARKRGGGADRMKSQAKAQGAGSVKRDCSIWEEFLTAEGVPHIFVPPGRNTKTNPAIFARMTQWDGKASQFKTWHHARDAAMLVYGR